MYSFYTLIYTSPSHEFVTKFITGMITQILQQRNLRSWEPQPIMLHIYFAISCCDKLKSLSLFHTTNICRLHRNHGAFNALQVRIAYLLKAPLILRTVFISWVPPSHPYPPCCLSRIEPPFHHAFLLARCYS